MTIKTMEDLFVETLKDIYYAEKHILKALPGMVKKAGSRKLKEALETHRKETEGQVDRLDQYSSCSISHRAARSARRSKES
jgi:ferritin-like metal-binding protein YciE